jgi:hypothetical protein
VQSGRQGSKIWIKCSLCFFWNCQVRPAIAVLGGGRAGLGAGWVRGGVERGGPDGGGWADLKEKNRPG